LRSLPSRAQLLTPPHAQCIGYPMINFWKLFSKFDLTIVCVSIIAEWILPAIAYNEDLWPTQTNDLKNIGRMTQSIRCLRVLTMSRKLRELLSTVFGVRHVIFRFFFIFLLLIYR
jgi:hypothetical protein